MVIENTSESFNLDLTPISGHPITAVTTWPVAVLAVRHVVLFQLVLHLLLDLDDLPGCKDSSHGIIWDHTGSYGIIWDHTGSYGIKLKMFHLGHCDQRFLNRQTRLESTARF